MTNVRSGLIHTLCSFLVRPGWWVMGFWVVCPSWGCGTVPVHNDNVLRRMNPSGPVTHSKNDHSTWFSHSFLQWFICALVHVTYVDNYKQTIRQFDTYVITGSVKREWRALPPHSDDLLFVSWLSSLKCGFAFSPSLPHKWASPGCQTTKNPINRAATNKSSLDLTTVVSWFNRSGFGRSLTAALFMMYMINHRWQRIKVWNQTEQLVETKNKMVMSWTVSRDVFAGLFN